MTDSSSFATTILDLLRLPLRWIYRISQFVRGLMAHVAPDEMLAVVESLPKAAVALFVEMPLDAQRHSLNVLYALRKQAKRQGQPLNPSLAAAGLLHDVGKIAAGQAGRGIHLWLRGPLVLAEAVAPGIMGRYADGTPESGWRYLLHVHLDHPAIGAEMAAKAGCDELTCWLIAQHQETPQSIGHSGSRFAQDDHAIALLSALRRADQRN